MTRPRPSRAALPLALACLALAACGARRSLRVTSEPSGALVRLDEEVIGETPLEMPFEHYGTRRLSLYLDGYRTWSEVEVMKAPWTAWFPIDLVTEVVLPLHLRDRHTFHVVLEPDVAEENLVDVEAFAVRATELHRLERVAGLEALEELERQKQEAALKRAEQLRRSGRDVPEGADPGALEPDLGGTDPGPAAEPEDVQQGPGGTEDAAQDPATAEPGTEPEADEGAGGDGPGPDGPPEPDGGPGA